MAVNLIEQFGRDRTREILESSFAQFQADRAVVDLARKAREQEKSLAGYAEAMQCHLGDFAEYAGIRRELSDLERKQARDTEGARAPRRAGSPPAPDQRPPPADEAAPVPQLQRPRGARPLGGALVPAVSGRPSGWRRQIRGRTGAVAQVFDRITELLLELSYLENDGHGRCPWPRPGARSAASTANATCSSRSACAPAAGTDSTRPASPRWRAAWSSSRAARMPRSAIAASRAGRSGPRSRRPRRSGRGSSDLEEEHRLPRTELPSAGLALATLHWAQGARLDSVLREADLAAGDFVRWMKQAIDLLDQVSLVADGEVGRTARRSIDAIRRGIVAYSSVA